MALSLFANIRKVFVFLPKRNTMAVTYRTITNEKTSIPAPISYPSSGTFHVVVDAENSHNLQYSGQSPLDNFGTPLSTGTIEPIIIDGETGINPYATGAGQLGYTYLLITSKDLLVKVLGIQFLALTSGTYTYLIQTDTDCSSVNTAQNFAIVFAKLVGYSYSVVSGTPTLNGVSFVGGDFGGEPQLSPMENRNGFYPPVYVDASSATLTVIENS